MNDPSLMVSRLFAEVLRLQHWAGGSEELPARIFGLMHGFESVIDQVCTPGISRSVQDKVEDLLQDVEDGKQPTDGMQIKMRLERDGISEVQASAVMRLCELQSCFGDAIEQIVAASGLFRSLNRIGSEEDGWFGALHYIEIRDRTEDGAGRSHAAFVPTVPRVGELVEPQAGSVMRVVEVRYVAAPREDSEKGPRVLLIPHVTVEPVEDTDDAD